MRGNVVRMGGMLPPRARRRALAIAVLVMAIAAPLTWAKVSICPDPGMCFINQDAKDAWARERGCVFGEPADDSACAVSLEMLQDVWPDASTERLQAILDELEGNLVEFNLDTPERLAHFFAQVRQETGPGLSLRESMNYKVDALKSTFSYFRNNPEEAERYGRIEDANRRVIQAADQEAIADRAYANRLGNGDVASGDGWSFRGGGLLQTTGRSNYQSLQDAWDAAGGDDSVDFLEDPDLLMQPEYAVASAVHFWTQNNLHLKADEGTGAEHVDAITAVINRHTSTYGNRQDHFTSMWDDDVFGEVECQE